MDRTRSASILRSVAGVSTAAALVLLCGASVSHAQLQPRTPPAALANEPAENEEVLISLDFPDAELSEVIDTIARLTDRNFIYDDRVRGKVTIVSPTKIPIEQAYAVFESVLQVKGFTTVETPGGAIKVIPIREAKESNVDTLQSEERPPNRDRFVTRLIPLRFIEAEPIVNTLKPLVSKDAAMAAYAPTNTVILTESASNIRRIISILEAIDVETYRESLTVIRIEHADAATLADQIAEIYGEETQTTGNQRSRERRPARPAANATPPISGLPTGSRVRIITDERTNSLIVLSPRQQLDDVRGLVAKLDVPITGGGRIHVYYLKNASSEELANTLNALLTGAPKPSGGAAQGGQAQALRVQVSALAEGISITADPATNSLVIQASQEGYSALTEVIKQLDRERPQVLVEALIMEVDITDNMALGFSGVATFMAGDTQYSIGSLSSAAAAGAVAGATGGVVGSDEILQSLVGSPLAVGAIHESGDTTISALLTAAASDSGINIVSAPHILTSDNEQAEIRIGDNIPIITSRVESAAGQSVGLSSSVNVERQDIGVTLRVTPQITEGDSLRLEIFQEFTAVNETLTSSFGESAATDVGVALSNRRIENTVVVANGETVVIGGLIDDTYIDTTTKVPWLGDIPFLGWAFKSTATNSVKKNLLVFLTPRVIRNPLDLEEMTIRKREELAAATGATMEITPRELEMERARQAEAEASGDFYTPLPNDNPVRSAFLKHELRYPIERMREIEQRRLNEPEDFVEAVEETLAPSSSYAVQAAIYGDGQEAAALLTRLIDSGFDGSLYSAERGGVVLYEIRLGPYPTLAEAEEAGEIVRRGFGLDPTVLVEPAGAP